MLQNVQPHGQHFAVGLLGPVVVTRDGVRRSLPSSRKTRGLLAYLALAPRPCRREDLCDLLWEGAPDPRSELRWSLAKIKAAVGSWLRVSSEGVWLADETLSVDAIAFRDMAREILSERRIAEALAIWRGPPLADVEVRGQHAFQAWLAAERDSLTGLRTGLLKAAVDHAWARPEEALSAARRLVIHEPWSEWGHARVVQLLERSGRFSEAAAYLTDTRRSLSRELGIPEAQALIESPPPPQIGSVGPVERQAAGRESRPVIQIEPLKLVPHDEDFARLAAQATAGLGSGLWRNGTCDLLDGESPARSYLGDSLEADFAVRGAIVRWEDAVQLSLRCVDLRAGTVVWFGQFEPGRPSARNLSQWVESAVEAIGVAVRVAGGRIGDVGALSNPLMTVRSLAGALQPVANRQAIALLNAVLAENADDPRALALAAWCYAQRAVYNWSTNPDQDRDEARRYAAAAARMHAEDAECLTMIATARTLVADRSGAAVLLDQVLRRNPRASEAHVRSGWLANYIDEPVRAVRHFGMALGLAPSDAASFNGMTGLGVAHFIRSDNIQAIRHMEQALALNPKAVWIYRNLVPAYAAVRDRRKAEEGVRALVKDHPRLTIAAVCDAMVFSPTVMAKISEGLSWAGLPRA